MRDIIVITGASSGLGLSLAKEAVSLGLLVCGIARNIEKLKHIKDELGDDFIYYSCDVSNQQKVEEIIKNVNMLGNIKYVINNAQTAIFKDITLYSQLDVETMLKGLEGMIFVSQAVLKIKEEKDVKIANVGSSASFVGKGKESIYTAVKWAERGYTESLKEQYKNTSVKIVGVYPGGMNTDFWKENRDYIPIEKTDKFMNSDDVAKTILNNVLDENVYVSDIRIARG